MTSKRKWTATIRKAIYRFAVVCLVLPAATLLGCSGGGGGVSGKVTYDGQPVKGGMITFVRREAEPIQVRRPTGPCKPMAPIRLRQEGRSSEAIAFPTHRRLPLRRSQAVRPKEHATPQQPYANLVPKQTEVDVKAGSNKIDIELVPLGAKK